MKSTSTALTLPLRLRQRIIDVGMPVPEGIAGVGNVSLLDEPLLALNVSRSCPGSVFIDIYEQSGTVPLADSQVSRCGWFARKDNFTLNAEDPI